MEQKDLLKSINNRFKCFSFFYQLDRYKLLFFSSCFFVWELTAYCHLLLGVCNWFSMPHLSAFLLAFLFFLSVCCLHLLKKIISSQTFIFIFHMNWVIALFFFLLFSLTSTSSLILSFPHFFLSPISLKRSESSISPLFTQRRWPKKKKQKTK